MSKIHDAELQYLTVAFAKDIGIDSRGRIVRFESDQICREDAQLEPLLIYSLVAPCYGLTYRELADLRSPLPLCQFLLRAWSIERGIGMPLRLELPAKLLALDRGVLDWVRKLGVDEGPAMFPKAITAFGISAQNLIGVTWESSDWREPVPSLADSNAGLRRYDEMLYSTSLRTSMQRLTFEAWLERPRRFHDGFDGAGMDWDVQALEEAKPSLPRPGLKVSDDDDGYSQSIRSMKQILSMWPSGRRGFMKGLNVTARDFDFWLKGSAYLKRSEFMEVLERVGADFDDWEGDYSLDGGNLLVASTPKYTDDVYTELAHGGDLIFSYELLPPDGAASLSMRPLVFKACSGPANIILFEVGSRAAALLDEPVGYGSTLINIQEPRVATKAVWASMRKIVENFRTFSTPQIVGRDFGEKHEAWLESRLAQY